MVEHFHGEEERQSHSRRSLHCRRCRHDEFVVDRLDDRGNRHLHLGRQRCEVDRRGEKVRPRRGGGRKIGIHAGDSMFEGLWTTWTLETTTSSRICGCGTPVLYYPSVCSVETSRRRFY